jgi:hypothetical protein
MRSRVLAVIVAVVVPVAVLGVVIARGGGSTHKPARLPIAAGGGNRENAALGAATADAVLYPYGGIVYKAGPNLPALDGSARAYKLNRDGADEQLGKLSEAFEGRDTSSSDDSATFVGDEHGITWSYSRQSFGGGVSSSGVAVACAPDTGDCPVPETTIPQHPIDLPSQEEAKAAALALLQGAGIDTEHATITVDDYVTVWSVRVDPVVDGVPTTGFGSTVAIGENGVVEYANGVLGRPERADEYPLIGTSAAIEKLNRGEIYYGGGPRPLIAEDTAAASGGGVSDAEPGAPGTGSTEPESAGPTEPFPLPACDGTGAPTTFACPPDTPSTGTIPPPLSQEVTLIGAERVLMFAASYDGTESWLVPAYRFTTEDGVGPFVLAIDDSFLAPPPGEERSDEPTLTIEPSQGFDDPGVPPTAIEPQPAPETKPAG